MIKKVSRYCDFVKDDKRRCKNYKQSDKDFCKVHENQNDNGTKMLLFTLFFVKFVIFACFLYLYNSNPYFKSEIDIVYDLSINRFNISELPGYMSELSGSVLKCGVKYTSTFVDVCNELFEKVYTVYIDSFQLNGTENIIYEVQDVFLKQN
jgi:hypothetical protein